MKRTILFTTVLSSALAVSATALAADPMNGYQGQPGGTDDRRDPASDHQRTAHATALQSQLAGKIIGQGKVHEVAKGQYVELNREGEDPIWTVLGEFANLQHNAIPEPDRDFDNSTIWEPDFGRDYYMNVLFGEGAGANSMRDFYIKQSSNRYAVYGDVTDWVPVPGQAASYDDDAGALAIWQFLIDSVNGWYQMQLDAGMTPAQIDNYLSQFDVWDRYDWDGDGNFNEPDGYIDHAQFVHAGMGNEAGGGVLGDDAIWSHSWYAYYNLMDIAGPSPDFLEGGIQIGQSSYWVGKYTIQPENGGVGVFAHEYAHDLGVPDLYDYYGENATGFWTLMSSGSWLSDGTQDIGSKPNHLGAWEKFQLGWLNYEVAYAGAKSEHKLGPAATNTKQAQGLFVVLPPKEVVEQLAAPFEGANFYYSGSGDNLVSAMIKPVTLAAGSTLTAQVNFRIEYGYDYGFVIISDDNGASWNLVPTNFGIAMTGESSGWEPLTADLTGYSGDVLIGFQYQTDEYVTEPGLMVDNIQIGAGPVDGAEAEEGWLLYGFKVSTGEERAFYNNYYLAEFRQYRDYDEGLRYAYNFVSPYDPDIYNWVEHYPYQDGMLVSYWDTSFTDNNVALNCDYGRCGGMLLPIDAHPDVLYRKDGYAWRNRVQTYDATFGLSPTDALTLHTYGEPNKIASLPASPVFNDTVSHYRPENPTGSVNHPNTGTQIRVKSISAQGTFMQVQVSPAK